MINKKILKPINTDEYTRTALWCNENDAHIEDKGSFFIVVANIGTTKKTETDKIKEEVLQLEQQTGYTRIIREIILATPVSEEVKSVAEKIEKIAIKLRKGEKK